MKNKRTLTITILLVAILLLGIGYAATTATFSIGGTATAEVNSGNFVVGFDTAEDKKPTTSDDSKVKATITNATTATLTVTGLTAKNDTVTATYNIKNSSPDLTADLTLGDGGISNDNSTYFTVTHQFAEDSIAQGESTTLTVTVKLNKTPVDDETEDLDATITIPLKATAVQPN